MTAKTPGPSYSSNDMVTTLQSKEKLVVKSMDDIHIDDDKNPTIPKLADRTKGTESVEYEFFEIPNIDIDGLAQTSEEAGGLLVNDKNDDAQYSTEYVRDRYKVRPHLLCPFSPYSY